MKLRKLLATNSQLRLKIEKIEKKYDKQLGSIFDVMKYLLAEKTKSKEPIGFEYKK